MIPDKTTLWIVKVCGVGVVCLGLYFWGRGHGVESGRAHNADLIVQKDRALNAAARSLAAAADVLDLVNRRTAEARVEAQAQALRADHAVKAAEVDRADYEARIGSIGALLEKAMRQPVCRAQLELPLCADLQ